MKHTNLHIQLLLSATLAWAMSAGACSFAGQLEVNETSNLVVFYTDSIYFKSVAVWAFLMASIFYRYARYFEVQSLAAILSLVSFVCAGNVMDEFFIEQPWITSANEYTFAGLGILSAVFESINFHPLKHLYDKWKLHQ